MFINIKSKILRDLFKVLSGNIIAQGIGFLTTIIISRDLGPQQYGIFSLLLAIFTIAVQISDFGISTSYVKYVSKNISKSKEIFFTVFISKIGLSLITGLAFFVMSEYISFFFFQTKDYAQVLQFISMAIMFHAFFSVIVAHYQAKQQFTWFAFLNISHNLLKLLTVLFISFVFVYEKHLTYFIYVYAYVFIYLLMVMTGKMAKPRGTSIILYNQKFSIYFQYNM